MNEFQALMSAIKTEFPEIKSNAMLLTIVDAVMDAQKALKGERIKASDDDYNTILPIIKEVHQNKDSEAMKDNYAILEKLDPYHHFSVEKIEIKGDLNLS